MQIAMIEDKILPFDEVEKPYLDRGLYFGDGVYEVLRSYNGRIFALHEHLERFSRSLSEIKINGVDIDSIRSKVEKAFESAQIPDAKIYFHITRGCAAREHTWDKNIKPSFFLTITELPDAAPTKKDGICVSSHPDWRWKRCDIKSLNLLANVLARQDAAEKGCDEAILVGEDGFITEGAASAFFAIFKDTLQTNTLKANVLPSITRKFVLRAAEQTDLQVKEKPLTPKQVIRADELFIGVTTKDIVPVVKFDGRVIGAGRPGKYTKELTEKFRKFTL